MCVLYSYLCSAMRNLMLGILNVLGISFMGRMSVTEKTAKAGLLSAAGPLDQTILQSE